MTLIITRKKINKCERKLNKLRIIKELENNGDFEKEVDGFITEFKDNFIVVYIPSIKLEEKIRLILMVWDLLIGLEESVLSNTPSAQAQKCCPNWRVRPTQEGQTRVKK